VPTAALLVAGTPSAAWQPLTGLAWAVVVAFAFQAVRGIAISAMDVGHNTEIQRVVPGHLLGRVFGNVYGAVGAAAGASYLMGGMLLELTDARTTLIVAGAGGLLVTAIVSIGLPRDLRHPDQRSSRRNRRRDQPIMTPRALLSRFRGLLGVSSWLYPALISTFRSGSAPLGGPHSPVTANWPDFRIFSSLLSVLHSPLISESPP
jgi:hypothetical protein